MCRAFIGRSVKVWRSSKIMMYLKSYVDSFDLLIIFESEETTPVDSAIQSFQVIFHSGLCHVKMVIEIDFEWWK